MRKSTLHFSILAFLFTLISACGGGSSGTSTPQTTPTPSTPIVVPTVAKPATPPVVTTPPITPPTATKLIITKDVDSPEPTDILRTNTKYAKRVTIKIDNPTSADQEITIPSLSTEGSLSKNVADVQIVSGNTVLGTAVISAGKAYFQSITIKIPAGTSKKITLQAKLNPYMQPLGANEWTRKVKFGFTSDDIISSQASISGLPVWGNYAYVEKGAFLYPSYMSFSLYERETGKSTVQYGEQYMYPTTIISARNANIVAVAGANLTGICFLSIPNASLRIPNCANVVKGSFDLTEDGKVVVATSSFMTIGKGEQTDVILIKTDGSKEYLRITNSTNKELSPAIGNHGSVSSEKLMVLYAEKIGNLFNIWRRVINTKTSTVGNAEIVIKNISVPPRSGLNTPDSKVFSVNKNYTKIVFERNVAGKLHLFVSSIKGDNEIDIGRGRNPYWYTDGSGRILFMYNGKLYTMEADGTDRRKVIIPGNFIADRFHGSLSEIIPYASH